MSVSCAEQTLSFCSGIALRIAQLVFLRRGRNRRERAGNDRVARRVGLNFNHHTRLHVAKIIALDARGHDEVVGVLDHEQKPRAARADRCIDCRNRTGDGRGDFCVVQRFTQLPE